jgi:hypothetical protein
MVTADSFRIIDMRIQQVSFWHMVSVIFNVFLSLALKQCREIVIVYGRALLKNEEHFKHRK